VGLIVWDESPMVHRHTVEAVDRLLRDIIAPHHPQRALLPFAGIPMVLAGDFRQTLPIVPRGTRSDIVAACLKSSPLWPHLSQLHLTDNMRAFILQQRGVDASKLQEWAAFLLRLGDGTQPADELGCVQLPDYVRCQPNTLQGLIATVYGDDIGSRHATADYTDFLAQRAILAPRWSEVDAINDAITTAADTTTYLSADSVDGDNDYLYPTELLNSLTPSGVPLHSLSLKPGVPIILMHNLAAGLANGTRMLCHRLGADVIDALVLTGTAAGQRVLIPRMSLQPSEDLRLPFHMKRHQFPVRPAFALSINKAQGQTLQHVGVYLETPVFGHGQLYGALSRTGNPDNVWVAAPGSERTAPDGSVHLHTPNMVFQEALA
jgi:hypothetical protein